MSIGPFLGKWLQEEKQPDNIDEYLKATGKPSFFLLPSEKPIEHKMIYFCYLNK